MKTLTWWPEKLLTMKSFKHTHRAPSSSNEEQMEQMTYQNASQSSVSNLNPPFIRSTVESNPRKTQHSTGSIECHPVKLTLPHDIYSWALDHTKPNRSTVEVSPNCQPKSPHICVLNSFAKCHHFSFHRSSQPQSYQRISQYMIRAIYIAININQYTMQ